MVVVVAVVVVLVVAIAAVAAVLILAVAPLLLPLAAARAERVVFAAYITQEPRLNASTGATVLFGGVITNIGSAFNPATSVFTAPYHGQYVFFVRVDISKDCFGVDFRRNGQRVAAANNDGYVSSHVNAGVALTLKAGDTVTVTFFSSRGYVDAGIESVFTGFRVA